MQNLAENHLVRFTGVSKKKDGFFVDFKAKGMKGGAFYNTRISVDFSAADVDPSDTLETIIQKCAPIAMEEFKKSDLQFEGIQSI